MTLTKSTHDEITEEEVLNLKNLGKIIISSNALTFENTVYQIRNISRATVWKWTHTKIKQVPAYQVLAWIFLGALTFAASEDPRVKVAAVIIAFAGINFYVESRNKLRRYSYLLKLELNSGSSVYFKSTSEDFLEKVIKELEYAIENPQMNSIVEANFVTQQIQVSNHLDSSVHIWGDIENGLINTGATKALSASWQK